MNSQTLRSTTSPCHWAGAAGWASSTRAISTTPGHRAYRTWHKANYAFGRKPLASNESASCSSVLSLCIILHQTGRPGCSGSESEDHIFGLNSMNSPTIAVYYASRYITYLGGRIVLAHVCSFKKREMTKQM
ncbi:hypothetical protein BC938DRAFT_475268 [Jimgerdemannia flammicorona]|uniref:Uncharacterized protein n=1 Tax=Jimgerdemannia flammicorona TaxID=994334 RepID=A0A433PXB4_9FUNG|nr:hypothetical protein BC938DRAFT_475268 [Jimgerdemannia flammicorona]